ncbi:hypothetical protein JCM15457_1946 [Liquorilactobacillus sucicola DSM 21376 = JCM 15457]|uniref:Uncharacterized protein n=1 Tax=Liquorilactobacillus sucicola DSM 21376 = JCM 15457 TaxID=1423806 RepID=A0A023CZG7_9LACO|nr:hypothetical protein FD15_GL000276 [Liquorilactobacillus sucicola DSM 21376 = JCM 15457]GAJ26991.1 hypothetical protein JCM15457_1946 [Liquorilactobacillus sucicola DSM 21376 = JCM 15457]
MVTRNVVPIAIIAVGAFFSLKRDDRNAWSFWWNSCLSALKLNSVNDDRALMKKGVD